MPENNLSDIVRYFKKYTSKAIKKAIEEKPESRREWLMMIFEYHAKFNKRRENVQFWTNENHAIELSSKEMIESRIDYIHQNPVRAGIVELEHHLILLCRVKSKKNSGESPRSQVVNTIVVI